MDSGKTVRDRLRELPRQPGVYLMRDGGGQVLYVGKAKDLSSRVRSYFRGRPDHPRTALLVRRIEELEWIVTAGEAEALILECNLIKEHRPPYNIRLVDDKHYPYLKIDPAEAFPRVQVVRRKRQDGARYFGPYTDVAAMHGALSVIRELFPLRQCGDARFRTRQRPCLNYQIRQCLAPCGGQVTPGEYGEMIQGVLLLLEGKTGDLRRALTREMEDHAGKMEYEAASRKRDQLRGLEALEARQPMILSSFADQDVAALCHSPEKTVVQVFFVRGGKVVSRDTVEMENTREAGEGELMAAFLEQYYAGDREIPGTLLLNAEPGDTGALAGLLGERRGKKVALRVPQRGEHRRLVHLAAENARLVCREGALQAEKERRGTGALRELAEFLGMERPPRRMECYDISNLGGSHVVGAMVVFTDGRPDPRAYRRFRIRSVEGPDDVASLEEVLRRRFSAARREDGRFARRPDLVVVDGGAGQLRRVRQAMEDAGAGDIETVALAKKEESLYRTGWPAPRVLPPESEVRYLLQRIRDEAHRFAIAYHRERRDPGMRRSVLDSIPGVGPRRKRALLQAFGSVEGIRRATPREIAAVLRLSEAGAEKIKEYLG